MKNMLLVINPQSGKVQIKGKLLEVADRFVKGLRIEDDFTVEEKDKRVGLTEDGIAKAERYFAIENLGDPENMEINHHIQEALKARHTMKRDVDYIIKDGEIVIVDEFTGRLMYGRRYSNGLHQAIEAKEGVFVQSESKTLATITLQNYFRMYNKLAGMTGTAKTEEDEFRDIYNMDVVVIPTNREIARIDRDDEVYGTEAAKFKAIANRIAEAHATGQPVLVGTISIENSEKISTMLKKRGVKHNVLNAKQHEKEAAIVAEAGRLGAVTIATNMAGRGTDIILGGNPEFEAKREMEANGFTEEQISFATSYVNSEDPEMNRAREVFHQLYEKYKAERADEQAQVKALGGLCIIGTERHESRRIDNQLRGRAGRQGDPGETQFFISLEDDLMRLFGGDRIQALMDKMGVDDQPIAASLLSKTIENAQKKVEGRNFEVRKYVLQYDNVMNKQREVIYDERRKVLFGEDLKDNILGMMDTLVENLVRPATMDSKFAEEWDIPAISQDLKRITPHFPGISYTADQIQDLTAEQMEADAKAIFRQLYDKKEAEVGTDRMREVERMILLRVVDNHWMDHIQAMDDLKQGIGLRAIGQKDPAAAYANEGFDMFEEMIGEIQQETVKYCYNVTVRTNTHRRSVIGHGDARKDEYRGDAASLARRAAQEAPAGGGMAAAGQMPGAAPEEVKKQETVRRQTPKIGRNDDCPCGSGKKYKNCCMKKDMMQ